jgi:hypothetical protein
MLYIFPSLMLLFIIGMTMHIYHRDRKGLFTGQLGRKKDIKKWQLSVCSSRLGRVVKRDIVMEMRICFIV